MSGAEAALVMGMMGSGALSGALSGQGNAKIGSNIGKSSGGVSVDPIVTLAHAIDMLNTTGSLVANYATSPTNLRSSYVQQPPTFTGGGLPMPIGVTSRDPAQKDPSLRSTPGYNWPWTSKMPKPDIQNDPQNDPSAQSQPGDASAQTFGPQYTQQKSSADQAKAAFTLLGFDPMNPYGNPKKPA